MPLIVLVLHSLYAFIISCLTSLSAAASWTLKNAGSETANKTANTAITTTNSVRENPPVNFRSQKSLNLGGLCTKNGFIVISDIGFDLHNIAKHIFIVSNSTVFTEVILTHFGDCGLK